MLSCFFDSFSGFIISHLLFALQINELQKIPAKWLRLEPWKNWCRSILVKIIEGSLLSSLPAEVDYGESPAFEVLKFREKEGYFGMSSEIRDVKPPSVILRVGQVKEDVLLCPKCKTSRQILPQQNIGCQTQAQQVSRCHRRVGRDSAGTQRVDYKIPPGKYRLVTTAKLCRADRHKVSVNSFYYYDPTLIKRPLIQRDRPVPQFAYIPQENLVPEKNTRIVHPKVEDYFEHFDGSHYIPRPWLKGLYPKD